MPEQPGKDEIRRATLWRLASIVVGIILLVIVLLVR